MGSLYSFSITKGYPKLQTLYLYGTGNRQDYVPANWNGRGSSAGAFRNELMLRMLKPDFVIGFHHNIDSSRLTKDCLQRARDKGIKVVLINKTGIR